MKHLTTLILAFLATSATLLPAPPTYGQELVFPQLVLGGGWEVELTLFAQGEEDSAGVIAFLDPRGDPLVVSIDGAGTSSHGYQLQRQTSRTYSLSKGGPAVAGFLRVSQSILEESYRGSIGGTLRYRLKKQGTTLCEFTVPASPSLTDALIPFDQRHGNRTAFSAISLSATPLAFTLYDDQGDFVEQKTLQFGELIQRAMFLDELFPGSKQHRGHVRIRAQNIFQLLVLNQEQTRLTPTPCLFGVAERALTITLNETSHWTVRLSQNGSFLHGVATSEETTELIPVTGGLYEGKLYLAIHTLHLPTGEAMEITLLATADDLDSEVAGTAVSVREGGQVSPPGTFQLLPPGS